MKDRREAALVQLEKLKADAKLGEIQEPAAAMDESARRRAMELMVRSRMRPHRQSAGCPDFADAVHRPDYRLAVARPVAGRLSGCCRVPSRESGGGQSGRCEGRSGRTPEEEEAAEEAAMLGPDSFGEEGAEARHAPVRVRRRSRPNRNRKP